MKLSQLNTSDYNQFYQTYISTLEEVTILEALYSGKEELEKYIKTVPNNKWTFAYAEGKWTLAEVLLHLIDTERVFQYRALCISRGDDSKFPGFDQDIYVADSKANNRTKESLLNEFLAVRNSTIALFESYDNNDLQKWGVASNSRLSVGASGFILSGHLKHHLKILNERYFTI
ncbi:DinB family protein [Cellulophaga sp. HaHaR_3_176]|uniref:DinB family protein n=1 Tax=Cellulophaga sp. HaHaR_3_176 TaxID=1942464 RepID=UPI001C1F303C|nr:DinB family protein [Cellulophaga sp. HaHaR_3_176]QWX85359.1 DinB family protein [Cellulophaga sp. HaHaR_3_176]